MFMITIFVIIFVIEGVISSVLLRYIDNPLYASAIGTTIGGISALPFVYPYFSKPTVKDILIWGTIGLVISTSLNTVARYLKEKDSLMHLIKESHPAVVMLTLFVVALFVVAPFSEEVLFRSLLLMGLLKICPPYISIILNGMIFSIVHIGAFWNNSIRYKAIHLTGIFLLGTMLAYMFFIGHNLTLNIIVHSMANIPGLISIYNWKE